MATLDRIAKWEQHLNQMPPERALRLVGTAIANRIALGNTREAGALLHIQNRILNAVEEFKRGMEV